MPVNDNMLSAFKDVDALKFISHLAPRRAVGNSLALYVKGKFMAVHNFRGAFILVRKDPKEY